jgi:hypothetical protein
MLAKPTLMSFAQNGTSPSASQKDELDLADIGGETDATAQVPEHCGTGRRGNPFPFPVQPELGTFGIAQKGNTMAASSQLIIVEAERRFPCRIKLLPQRCARRGFRVAMARQLERGDQRRVVPNARG